MGALYITHARVPPHTNFDVTYTFYCWLHCSTPHHILLACLSHYLPLLYTHTQTLHVPKPFMFKTNPSCSKQNLHVHFADRLFFFELVRFLDNKACTRL